MRRAGLALLLLLALAGCERGPDAARLAADLQARLDRVFGPGALELAWMRRSGSAPMPGTEEAAIVYFDAEISVAEEHDLAAWDSPGLAGLATVMGAAQDGIARAETSGRLQLHGALAYRRDGAAGWVSDTPMPAPPPAPGQEPARGLMERVGAVLEIAARDTAGPGGAIVTRELQTALATIERRLARARSVYGFATGAPGGEYWRLGQAYARFGAERGIQVANLATGGSVENLRLLRTGEADLGLVQSDVALQAHRGEGLFARLGPAEDLRALASLYPEPVHVVTRRGSGIGGIADLAGRRVDLGPLASGTRRNALAVLEAHGLALSDLAAAGQSGPGPALAALRSGEVDAVFLTMGAPARLIGDALIGGDARLLPLDAEAAGRIADADPGLVALSLPAHTYPGQTAPLPTVAATALLVTTREMPDGEAATLLSWTFDEMPFLRLGSLQGTRISRATGRTAIGLPLHPAAEAFFAGETLSDTAN